MLIEPQVLRALCVATQSFVNLREIESTQQVKAIFDAALAQVSRKVRLPNGEEHSPRLQWSNDITVADLERDRRNVKKWLLRFLERNKNDAAMREELSATLQRLLFSTAIDFNVKSGSLRLFPFVFGVETACYLTAAAMLEPKTSAYVRRCDLVECPNLILHPGGKSHPTWNCSKAHADVRGKPRYSKPRRRKLK